MLPIEDKLSKFLEGMKKEQRRERKLTNSIGPGLNRPVNRGHRSISDLDLALVKQRSHFHHLSSWGDEESLQETRRKICLNLKENLDGIRVINQSINPIADCYVVCLLDCHLKPNLNRLQLNKRLPY